MIEARASSRREGIVGTALPACTIEMRDLRVLVTAGAGGIGRAIAEKLVAAGAMSNIFEGEV